MYKIDHIRGKVDNTFVEVVTRSWKIFNNLFTFLSEEGNATLDLTYLLRSGNVRHRTQIAREAQEKVVIVLESHKQEAIKGKHANVSSFSN